MYNNENSNYENWMKDAFLWIGIGLALVSIYFSWDGLYKSVPPDKAANAVAKWIGLLLAVGFTALQFIFNSDFKKLNPTLFILGLISYIYSILTNKWGISDIFGFPESISWVIAFGMDVAPEAMIAWSLEDITKGDMIGNVFGKFGSIRRGGTIRPNKSYSAETARPERAERNEPVPDATQPKIRRLDITQQHQGKHGKGSQRRHFLEEAKKSGKGNFFG